MHIPHHSSYAHESQSHILVSHFLLSCHLGERFLPLESHNCHHLPPLFRDLFYVDYYCCIISAYLDIPFLTSSPNVGHICLFPFRSDLPMIVVLVISLAQTSAFISSVLVVLYMLVASIGRALLTFQLSLKCLCFLSFLVHNY